MRSNLGSRSVAASTCVVLAAAAWLSACDRIPESLKKPNMTALSPRLKPLFDKTRTVCFGRFVVEVPASAVVVFGPAKVPDSLERFESEGGKLDEKVTARESELRSQPRYPRTQGLTLYKETLDGAMPGQKIVIGWETFGSSFYKVESFVKVGADVYVQHTQASPKDDEEHRSAGWTVSQNVAVLNTIARHLRSRADDEMPTDPGVCIDGGFIADNAALTHERIAIGIRLKEFPDVHFSIEVNKNQEQLVESNALEPRLKQAEKDTRAAGAGDWYSRVKFFRRGDREINGWHGFEVLARKPAQEGGSENHQFAFLSHGEIKSPLKPELDVQLDTGVHGNDTAATAPSLTDEEAVALWDKLTSSIRVRPTGGAVKTSDATPPKAPLGELAATGRACPQTGWWECIEQSRPVQEGRRQFFRTGERMPHAVLLGEPSVWQKLKGEQPSYKTATVWKLVDYDDPPASPTAMDVPDSAAADGAPSPEAGDTSPTDKV